MIPGFAKRAEKTHSVFIDETSEVSFFVVFERYIVDPIDASQVSPSMIRIYQASLNPLAYITLDLTRLLFTISNFLASHTYKVVRIELLLIHFNQFAPVTALMDSDITVVTTH